MCHAAVLCHAVLRYAMPCHAMLCHTTLCDAMPCYTTLRYAILCYAIILHHTISYNVISPHTISHHIISGHVQRGRHHRCWSQPLRRRVGEERGYGVHTEGLCHVAVAMLRLAYQCVEYSLTLYVTLQWQCYASPTSVLSTVSHCMSRCSGNAPPRLPVC